MATVMHGGKNPKFDVTNSFRVSESRVKGKIIPVAGRGGQYGCEKSRLPYFLHNRLTDDGEAVSLMLLSPFTPRKIPGTHFC
jgi:hypothetical protein